MVYSLPSSSNHIKTSTPLKRSIRLSEDATSYRDFFSNYCVSVWYDSKTEKVTADVSDKVI